VGTALACADRVFAWLPALAALTSALLIQIATNLTNDYFDYVKGVDTVLRRGPTRAAQSGLISLPQLRAGIAVTFVAAMAVGLYLVLVGGWPILVIGLASLASAAAYTGGPLPIGYHGLGDLFVFLFFGLAAVCGTYYVQAQTVTPLVAAAAIPPGALTVAILVVNNLRDIDTDRLAGKRSLAVLIGARYTRLEYLVLLALSYSVPVLLCLASRSSFWVMLPLLTLPLALRLIRTVYHATEGPALNRALAGTANLDLAFSLLLSIGLLI
jgi:1,4-dihydroxy-2-naphthoate octaprenyltransferase